MRVLTLSSLFPGAAAPRHGTFVRERMRAFRDRTGAGVKVVSPVPWFPRGVPSRKYAAFARAPRRETVDGFDVHRPRYAMIPKVGVPLQGILYELGVRGTVKRLLREWDFDLLDVHYAYPDGFAGALLAHRLRKPMVLTVRGTDVNHLPDLKATRDQVRFALEKADRVVAVSAALAECAVAAGATSEKTVVLRNGVDPERFRPVDRDACRAALGVPADAAVLVSVGFLVPRKGHDLTIRAVASLPEGARPHLLIAGDGPEEERLRALIAELGVADRVRLLGPVEHGALSEVFSAADLSVLASSREGWPNVLLESMACGTPVVATAVHGSPEVVRDRTVGRLVEERTVEALAAAIRDALEQRFDREAVRAYAESMGWEETTRGLHDLFREVLGGAA